ncbi:MAG: hypothetical protein ACOC8N_01680 [Spirochaetota bacterium]
MRRADKEIADRREILDVLESARICRIALCDGDTPYSWRTESRRSTGWTC